MRRHIHRAAVSIVVWAIVVLAAASTARAQSSVGDEQKRLGDEAMVALRYEEALTHYRRAYEAAKSPALLYNMGRAHEGLGDFPKALDELEAFAEQAPPALKARVPGLESLLLDVRKRVSTVIVSSPVAGAEIRIGNTSVATTKAGQTLLRVNAGPKALAVNHPDYFPFERTLPFAPGKVELVDLKLASRSAGALLVVMSPVAGAQVAVDGIGAGNVPTEVPAKPGQHRITLQKRGYDPADASLVLVAGERKEVTIPMARTDSIVEKWWFWTGIGVVVAAGATVAIIAATTEKDPGRGTIAPGTVKAQGWAVAF